MHARMRAHTYTHVQFGLGGVPVEVLDEEQQQLLLESIASDPAWASRGQPSCQKPFQLRAGRVVLELYDAEVGPLCCHDRALMSAAGSAHNHWPKEAMWCEGHMLLPVEYCSLSEEVSAAIEVC
eukprot:scaffold143601_cov16-Tisochrysis_lutea.AAC.1